MYSFGITDFSASARWMFNLISELVTLPVTLLPTSASNAFRGGCGSESQLLPETIRREYQFGAGTIKGVARKLGIHRRMVRELGRSLVFPGEFLAVPYLIAGPRSPSIPMAS